ncbi:MAG: PepSY-associated TM helix domain-containing protein [Paraglaciecola sp.]|uniref:PepSY-associated TM helix domain-containing protein n=1 Tax=Paraglaciecola sp. TaxID=1920173 RepID=UPI00329A68E0
MKSQIKNKFVKNITDAHSWLGLIISIALFAVFWAGAISLFKNELELWASAPHVQISDGNTNLSYSEIFARQVAENDFNNDEHIAIMPANAQHPWHKVYVDLMPDENGQEQIIALMIDPTTGQSIGQLDSFNLVNFLYQFHYTLSLPAGVYIVGVITLIFCFLLFSGIFIHAKKLFKNFFTYRTNSNKRDQLLDLHNVIGVISLPFTLMFALTGLILNIVIVYQIVYALIVYQGDQQKLLADAGFPQVNQPASEIPMGMEKIDELVAFVENKYEKKAGFIQVNHYGDENAYLRIIGEIDTNFTPRFEVYYSLKDFKALYLVDENHRNITRDGVDVLVRLHYANFASLSLKILYFILALGVCALIIAGNILWLNKREKQSKKNTFDYIIAKLTLGGCSGIIVSTAVAFGAERFLPFTMFNRANIVESTFFYTWLVAALLAFPSRSYQHYLKWSLRVAAAFFILVGTSDWWLGMLTDMQFDYIYSSFWGIQCSFFILATIGLLTSRKFKHTIG